MGTCHIQVPAYRPETGRSLAAKASINEQGEELHQLVLDASSACYREALVNIATGQLFAMQQDSQNVSSKCKCQAC